MEMRTVFNSPVLTHTKEPNAEGELLSETLKEELGLFGNKITDRLSFLSGFDITAAPAIFEHWHMLVRIGQCDERVMPPVKGGFEHYPVRPLELTAQSTGEALTTRESDTPLHIGFLARHSLHPEADPQSPGTTPAPPEAATRTRAPTTITHTNSPAFLVHHCI